MAIIGVKIRRSPIYEHELAYSEGGERRENDEQGASCRARVAARYS